MKISVNEQTQTFYIAGSEWVPTVGHEIRVGDYRFCALPLESGINISEVTSGMRVLNLPLTEEVHALTETKEGSMIYFLKVGEGIKKLIEEMSDFDEHLSKMVKKSVEKLGKIPPIEDYDSDWIYAEQSDVLK
ncbi:hypothetical protein QTG56_25605 (plasmid) [Rossellomorea sp. AcN35-11]|nr:hypothetical protein [Rossellomorea aquimaris]WJV31992.1 hypothetical protein QTG56_25605 [Rossellomorea sp. AcN35-11]